MVWAELFLTDVTGPKNSVLVNFLFYKRFDASMMPEGLLLDHKSVLEMKGR